MVRHVNGWPSRQSRREHWRGLVTESSASGQTQVAFCRAPGLNAATSAWWNRQWCPEGWASAGATARRDPGALRPIVLERKNWLFAASDHLGRTGAMPPSQVPSSKRHGVDPFAYLQGRPDADHAHTGESAR